MIPSDGMIHFISYKLAVSLLGLDIPAIIALGIHHISELVIAIFLSLNAITIAVIMVVALVPKTSEEINNIVDVAKGIWTTAVGSSRAIACWIDCRRSKVCNIVLVPILLCVSVQGVVATVGVGIPATVPSCARVVPTGSLLLVIEVNTAIVICFVQARHFVILVVEIFIKALDTGTLEGVRPSRLSRLDTDTDSGCIGNTINGSKDGDKRELHHVFPLKWKFRVQRVKSNSDDNSDDSKARPSLKPARMHD